MMKRLGTFSTLLMLVSILFGQQQYVVNVSDRYYAKVYLSDSVENDVSNWIGIYERGSDKELIKVDAGTLAIYYDEHDNVKINVKETPYGEQSVIIYEDFNFDGVSDFAIQDGQNSCYGGPSFQIYLAQGDGFVYSNSFTDLSQNYCGMFQVDTEHKRLYTMTKSGCCWHQYSDFSVVDNKPVAEKVVEEAVIPNGCFLEYSISERVDSLMTSRVYNTVIWETEPLFSFKIAKTGKIVFLFECMGELRYCLLKPNDEIEFAYPSVSDISGDKLDFKAGVDVKDGYLEFSVLGTVYRVYESGSSVGVLVKMNGKEYDLTGDINTRIGRLKDITANTSLTNVDVQL